MLDSNVQKKLPITPIKISNIQKMCYLGLPIIEKHQFQTIAVNHNIYILFLLYPSS